jgi:hypothetical protein
MKMKLLMLMGVTAGCIAGPAMAHHSGAMFDRTKTLELKGTVKSFGWTNPHAWILIDVPNAQGGGDEWNIEGVSPNVMIQQGWKKSSAKPGDKITLIIHPMKDGSRGGSLESAVLADGQKVGSGRQAGGDPPPATPPKG